MPRQKHTEKRAIRKGSKHHCASWWAEHLANWESSGLSKAAYCIANDLSRT